MCVCYTKGAKYEKNKGELKTTSGSVYILSHELFYKPV